MKHILVIYCSDYLNEKLSSYVFAMHNYR